MPTELEVIGPRAGSGSVTYTLTELGTVDLQAVYAHFNGAAASGAFRPTLTIRAQNGAILGRLFPDTELAAGDTADVTFVPFRRSAAEPAPPVTSTYTDLVAALTNKVAWWRMEALSGNQPDYAANPLGDKPLILQSGTTHGTWHINGASQLVASGDDDGAWRGNLNEGFAIQPLNGADYFLATDAVASPRWAFPLQASFSVAFFLYPRSGWTNSRIPIIGTDIGTGVVDGWSLQLLGAASGAGFDGKVMFNRGNGGSEDDSNLNISPVAMPRDEWTWVLYTYNGPTVTHTLYFNNLEVHTSASGVNCGSQQTIRVMAGTWNAATQGHIYGAIDEVTIWSRVLTSAERASLWGAL